MWKSAYVVSIYLDSFNGWVFACGQKVRPCVHGVSDLVA